MISRFSLHRSVLSFVVGLTAAAPAMVRAQATGDSQLWLHLSGTQRSRYEYLWNQFQQGTPGDDRALSLRTIALAELRYGAMSAGVELADSRVYLADDDVPLNTTHVNPVDVLQVYVTGTARNLFLPGAGFRFKLGRQTMDVGSRRLVARNRFRNTINAFNGLDLEWTGPKRESVHGFLVVPVERRVKSLRENEPQLDIERTEALFWGVVLGSSPLGGSMRAELQVFGLHERDSEEYATRNRNFVTPGFRIFREPAAGAFDFQIEAVLQAGTSRSSTRPDDTADLSHFAYFAHGSIGYTLAGEWKHRFVLQYDYASGDKDPTDEENGTFDTLFGARRFDFGPTGIYVAFARGNLSTVGMRCELALRSNVDGLFAYRPFLLAQARDRWTATNIWDPDGQSGTFLGHQIEGNATWRLPATPVTLELGFARIWLGGFPQNAPNGRLNAENPTYVYAQTTVRF